MISMGTYKRTTHTLTQLMNNGRVYNYCYMFVATMAYKTACITTHTLTQLMYNGRVYNYCYMFVASMAYKTACITRILIVY